MPMTNQEIIAVVQAAEAGKRIQWKQQLGSKWFDTDEPTWDFSERDYRVAPEPLECWVNVYPDDISAHKTEQRARKYANSTAVRVAVRMREVVE